MTTMNLLSPWIKRFILEYLINVRNLARNTQKSYRDTFKLMLPFIAKKVKKPIDSLTINDITPEAIKSFLLHLESNRKCGVATRNQRLAQYMLLATSLG